MGAMLRLPKLGAMLRLPKLGAMLRLPKLGAMLRLPKLGAMLRLPKLGAMLRLPKLGASSITLHVLLPSGRTVAVIVSGSSSILELKTAARKSLKVGILELIAADGRMLCATETLESSGLCDGDFLTAVVPLPKIASSDRAFLMYFAGGALAWGNASQGGDCSQVQERLRKVQDVKGCSGGAFAAILEDGSALAWGNPRCRVAVARKSKIN